jgi:hypothetical protein
MPIKWAEAECRCMRNLARLSIAIGGFLIVTSLVLTGIIFLILMNIIEIDVFADQTNTLLLTLVLLVIGVLDFVAGIILMLKR